VPATDGEGSQVIERVVCLEGLTALGKVCVNWEPGTLSGRRVSADVPCQASEGFPEIQGGSGGGNPSASERGWIGEEALDVFGEQIGFQVDLVSLLERRQPGDLEGVRDDPQAKSVPQDLGDGQADPVDGDGTLFDDVFEKRSRGVDFEAPVLMDLAPLGDRAHPVDMSRDNVAIEASVDSKRTLQVDEGPFFEVLEACPGPGFLEQIHRDDAAGGPAAELGHGEAASVDGQAIPEFKIDSRRSRPEFHADSRGRLIQGKNDSGLFDDSCEHGLRSLMVIPETARHQEVVSQWSPAEALESRKVLREPLASDGRPRFLSTEDFRGVEERDFMGESGFEE